MADTRLAAKDRGVIALLLFFVAVAWTVELYWFIHARELPARVDTDWLAAGFRWYGRGDRAYFDQVNEFSLGLETLHIFITAPMCLWLIYAILQHRPYRHALQLTMGSYLAYSVVLYFWTAQLSGYALMADHTPMNFAIFYVVNLPWLLGALCLAADSCRAITARFRAGEAG